MILLCRGRRRLTANEPLVEERALEPRGAPAAAPTARAEAIILIELLAARAALKGFGRRPLLRRRVMHTRRCHTSTPLRTCSSTAIDIPHVDECASSPRRSLNRFSQFEHLYGLATAHCCDTARHTTHAIQCEATGGKRNTHLLQHCHRLPTHPAVRIEPVMLAETLAARAAVIRIGRRPLLHRHAMHARRQQTSASKPLHTCSSSAIDLPHIDKCASSLHCSPNRLSQFQHLYGLAEAHSCDAAQHTCYPKRRCSIKTTLHTCSSTAIDFPHVEKCASSPHSFPNCLSQFRHLYGLAEAHSWDAAQHTCYPKERRHKQMQDQPAEALPLTSHTPTGASQAGIVPRTACHSRTYRA